MDNKPVLVGLLVLGLIATILTFSKPLQGPQDKVGGVDFAFTSVTNTSTTAGIYNWTAVKYSGTGSQGFVSFCHNNDTPAANNPIYLGFGATSTKPYGYRLDSGQCYNMSLAANNMFYGTVYALASTATTTLLEVYK